MSFSIILTIKLLWGCFVSFRLNILFISVILSGIILLIFLQGCAVTPSASGGSSSDSTGSFSSSSTNNSYNGTPGLAFTLTNGGYIVTAGTATNGNIIIPSTYNGLPVTSIGYDAFCGLPGITGVTIPSSVTSIGRYAFWACSIPTVTIPASIMSIGNFAFTYCCLNSVTLQAITPPALGSEAFNDCDGWYGGPNVPGTLFFVPSSCSAVYRSAAGWSIFSNEIITYSSWCNSGTITNEGTSRNFSALDIAISNIPAAYEDSIQDVVNYIQSVSQDDWDRARGAYDWIAYNIAYDVAYNNGAATEVDPQGVFSNRKAVCEGYSELFMAMAEDLGLQATVIGGHGGQSPNVTHVWNAVLIDGAGHLLDSCWGAGGVSSSNVFCPYFVPSLFDLDPRLFAFNHYPADTNMLLFYNGMTLNDYLNAPVFNGDVGELLSAGYTADEILEMSQHLPLPDGYSWYASEFAEMGGNKLDMITWLIQAQVPMAYYPPGYTIRLLQYPSDGELIPGKTYDFVIDLSTESGAWIIEDGNWISLTNDGVLYSGAVTINSGISNVGLFICLTNGTGAMPIMQWTVSGSGAGASKFWFKPVTKNYILPMLKSLPKFTVSKQKK